MDSQFSIKDLLIIVLITSIWINASEIVRYFCFVQPAMQAHWSDLDGIAEMNLGIFTIWGLWDTILSLVLVLITGLVLKVVGQKSYTFLYAGTLVWATVFLIFWIGAANMGLASWKLLWIALPLAWLEMIIGSWLAIHLFNRFNLARCLSK